MKNSGNVMQSVKSAVKRRGLIQPGDTVLAALSGGADSVCLLHLLYSLKEELRFELCAAHLNHGIRGDEADRDEAYARELCQSLGVTLYCETADVKALAASEDLTLEEAGRKARYQYFARLRQEKQIDKIATAHNQNDQAETVLMRILRGTGIEGLCGIRPMREDGVIRPLLEVSRPEIEEYCREHKLSYCTDSTNLDNQYTRNRIRNELIPLLAERYNPRIIDALSGLAENVSEDAEFLNGYAQRLYERINSPLPSKKPVVLHIDSLQMVGRAIQARLVKIAARKAMGEEYRLEKRHVSDTLRLCEKQTGAEAYLPGYLVVRNQYGWLEFTDGRIEVEEAGTGFCIEAEPGKRYELPSAGLWISLEVHGSGFPCGPDQMKLDFDRLEVGALTLRSRRKGDRISLYRDGRGKKLKRFLIDQKIPRQERDQIVLLCSGEKIAAVVGCRVAGPYQADESTGKVLVITYGDQTDSSLGGRDSEPGPGAGPKDQ